MKGVLTFEDEQIFPVQSHDVAVAFDSAVPIFNVIPGKKSLLKEWSFNLWASRPSPFSPRRFCVSWRTFRGRFETAKRFGATRKLLSAVRTIGWYMMSRYVFSLGLDRKSVV